MTGRDVGMLCNFTLRLRHVCEIAQPYRSWGLKIFAPFLSTSKIFSGGIFEEVNEIKNAIFLELNRANIKSFSGIVKLGQIKRLELHHCIKLESDHGISEIKDSIQWLNIDTSKKFVPKDELFTLKNLRVLCLNNCGAIESLDFLKNFLYLVDFRFVNTNILDGNLTSLLEHPNLLNARFLN